MQSTLSRHCPRRCADAHTLHRRSARLLQCGALCLAAVTACASPDRAHIQLSGKVHIPGKTAVIFFADGMDRAVTRQMLRDGLLPNIQEFFVEGGVRVDDAVDTLPSITYVNSVSLLTGCFGGKHGIMGNEWFDRDTLQYREYLHAGSYRNVNKDFYLTTVFEHLDDELTVNVQSHTYRGATRTHDPVMLTGLDWFTHNFEGVDRRVGYGIDAIVKMAQWHERWPVLTLYYFPGLDEIGHRKGSNSEDYRNALRTVDGSIGRVCRSIREHSLAENTYFVLMTDHSHVVTPPGRFWDIERALKGAGFVVHIGERVSGPYATRLAKLHSVDIVLVHGDSRRAHLHIQGNGGWSTLPDESQVESILQTLDVKNQPAVDLAVYRDRSGRVHVRSRKGRAIIERRMIQGRKQYRLLEYEQDPLGYRPLELDRSWLEGEWHDDRAWLGSTAGSSHPDFVPQAVEMFDTIRAGDLVLFAADHWTFNANGWAGGHGSALSSDMSVPMYFAGPELPRSGHIPTARLVDIMPTLLDLLDRPLSGEILHTIDGISLAEQLRSAPTSTSVSEPLPVPEHVSIHPHTETPE